MNKATRIFKPPGMGFTGEREIVEKITFEVVYTWPDGIEEVRYRRPIYHKDSKKFIKEIDKMNKHFPEDSPYSYRFVD